MFRNLVLSQIPKSGNLQLKLPKNSKNNFEKYLLPTITKSEKLVEKKNPKNLFQKICVPKSRLSPKSPNPQNLKSRTPQLKIAKIQ